VASSGAGGGGGGSTIAPGARTTVNTTVPGQVSIDVALSAGLAGGDTVAGGSGAGDPLTLASTGNATRGPINVRDLVALITEDKVLNAAAAPGALLDVVAGRNLTLSSATVAANTLTWLRHLATQVYGANAALVSTVGVDWSPILKNDGVARTIQQLLGVRLAPTVRADTVAQTFNFLQLLTLLPVFDTVNAGTGTTTGAVLAALGATINAGHTLSALTDVNIGDATGAGTLGGPQVGIDIATLTKGTTNIGIRNASPYVDTPQTKVITLATDTIPNNTPIVRLNNTTAGAVTLGGTVPVIAAGQQGQRLTLITTSVQSVILPDQSVTAGSLLMLPAHANFTLAQKGIIELVYSTNLANWVCASSSVN
jgi:hypothetical protein